MAERTERRKRLDELRRNERVETFGKILPEIEKMIENDIDPLDFINEHITSYRGRKKLKTRDLKTAINKEDKKDLRQEILVLEDCISELVLQRMHVYNWRRNKKPELDGIDKRRIYEQNKMNQKE